MDEGTVTNKKEGAVTFKSLTQNPGLRQNSQVGVIQVKQKLFSLENIVVGLWIINLFKPEWILAYYVPGTEFVRILPTVLLYPAFIYLLFFSGRKLILDKPYLIFFLAALLSTVFAYNNGISRQVLRYVAESLILYILSVSVIKDEKNIFRLFKIYFWSFIFYGLWGIASGGLVPFHVHLNNEDAFGPFMAMGVPMIFFTAHRKGSVNYKEMSGFVLCIIGVVASFARGAFLSLCAGIVYIWYRYHRKIMALFLILIIFLIILATAAVVFREDSYWKEMSTIFDAHKEEMSVGDTGRQFLWKKALEMFIENPITGVGLRNYGFVITRYTTPAELERRDSRYSEIYGKVPHNIYLQLLSEMGTVGSVAFFFLVAVFFKRNRRTSSAYEKLIKQGKAIHQPSSSERIDNARKYYYLTIAIQGAFVIYLVNGLFYDLLYIHWLSDLLIMNSLVYQLSRRDSLNEGADHGLVRS